MGAISITKLYELLIPKLGKDGAENLTTFIDYKFDNGLENNTKRLATKEDLGIVKTDLPNVRIELANVRIEVANVRTEVESVRTEVESVRTEVESVRTEVANVKAELLDKMGQITSNMIRWMFVFWIGQLAATISIILLFVRK